MISACSTSSSRLFAIPSLSSVSSEPAHRLNSSERSNCSEYAPTDSDPDSVIEDCPYDLRDDAREKRSLDFLLTIAEELDIDCLTTSRKRPLSEIQGGTEVGECQPRLPLFGICKPVPRYQLLHRQWLEDMKARRNRSLSRQYRRAVFCK
eukprot:gene386-420_t